MSYKSDVEELYESLQKEIKTLENEMKLRNKDAYIKGKYLKDEEQEERCIKG